MSVPSFFFDVGGQLLTDVASILSGKALPIGRDIGMDAATHDLTLATGDLTMVADGQAIRQEADIRLQFLLGEWFLDTTVGLPLFQQILVKSPNLAAIRTVLSNEILNVTGISSILELTLNNDQKTRKLTVFWRADSDFGELTSTQEF